MICLFLNRGKVDNGDNNDNNDDEIIIGNL
jgi:hypothetical protein